MDQIIAIAFGDHIPGGVGVLMDVRIKSPEGEGTRDSIVMAYPVLEQWLGAIPTIIAAIDDAGPSEPMPAAEGPVPDWNEGRTLKAATPLRFLCTGFGVADVAEGLDGVVAVIEAQSTNSGETFSAEYLMPRSIILKLQEAIPKVLRKGEQLAQRAKLQ